MLTANAHDEPVVTDRRTYDSIGNEPPPDVNYETNEAPPPEPRTADGHIECQQL